MASKAEEQKSYEDYCKEAILSLKDRKESVNYSTYYRIKYYGTVQSPHFVMVALCSGCDTIRHMGQRLWIVLCHNCYMTFVVFVLT